MTLVLPAATPENKAAPQIYVACLASYTAGHLFGQWIDATQEIDAIQEAIAAMLKSSPVPDAEEWAIHDYNDFYEASSILGEYPDLEKVIKAARFIAEHEQIAAKLIAHWGDVDEAIETMQERYHGCYKSLEDYAEEYIKESGIIIPESLQYYIDYEKMAWDWTYSGDIFTIITSFEEVHVFASH